MPKITVTMDLTDAAFEMLNYLNSKPSSPGLDGICEAFVSMGLMLAGMENKIPATTKKND